MIDLLVNDLLECIKQEIDRNKSDETVSEIRVFTASFPPYVIKQLFERLENHILELDAVSVVCRIGSTLYQHWLSQSDVNPDELIAFETKEWIDGRELTYYRNQKCSPPFKKLVTVLAGVDTALDSAGLADFVVLTEESVWQNSMRKSYINWITKTFIDCGLEMADPLIEDANWFFEDLYKVFPRDLAHLSRFLELVREHSSEFSGGRDFLSFLYSSLNVWGVPPIVQSSRQKCRKLFQQAVKFIQYSDYIDRTNRRKALSKIDNFLLEMGEGTRDFPAPDAVRSNSSIEPEEYLYLARTYIEQNDPIAKATLLTFDCTPLLDLLARRVTVDRSKVVNKLVGPCYQSFLRSICGSLMRACRQVGVPTELLSVDIMVTKFVHEFIEDDENDSSRAALDLLRGLLGGIEEYLNMSIEIPLSDNGLHLIEVETQCDLTEGGIRIITSHVGTPYIEFSVTVNLNGGDQLEDTYRWVCPDVHEERVLYNLGRAIHARMQNHLGISIPAFTLSTYDELFFSSGSEEANRLFLLGLDQLFEVRNVLSENMQQKIRQLPDLSRLLTQLRAHYSGYIQCLIQDGYFQALKSRATSLINAYEDLLVYVISNRSIADSDLGYALCKAFLVTRENVVYSERHLSSAIAFALTPAVIEILQARESYLRAAFPSTVAETLNDDKPSMRQFEHLVSMLEIKRPIVAIVKDRNRSLTTQSRSLGLIQCIGDKPTERLPLASQAVLQEDSADEEITASELFFPNSQAKIFARTLTDYLSVNPHAQDGLSILALDIDDVQSLVAGVDVFLTKLLSTRPSISPPYQFSLKIITRTCTALSIHKWLAAWRLRWDKQTGQSKYRNCEVSVSHRHVTKIADYQNIITHEKDPIDVAFLVSFMSSTEGGDDFEDAQAFEFDPSAYLKFPMAEYPRPTTDSEVDKWRRYTVVGNRRMRISTLHSELSCKIKSPDNSSRYHIVTAPVDYHPWVDFIDSLHKRASWVACVDPYVDRTLLSEKTQVSDMEKREIVGFSTGLGSYGELNVTVSTEAETLAHLVDVLAKRLGNLFTSWDRNVSHQSARNLINQAQRISGLSLVKATGSNEYIRDYASYAIVRKNLPTIPGAMCDVILPLDSFRHWMKNSLDMSSAPGDEGMYPDLLHLVAFIEEGQFKIEAAVIECKLAQKSVQHLNKAIDQVRKGLFSLVQAFLPRGLNADKDQYDRRYWWAQLQRVIATHSTVSSGEKRLAVAALENLAEGLFAIAWRAVIVTLWTDEQTEGISQENASSATVADRDISIFHIACGPSQVADMCLSEEPLLSWPVGPVELTPQFHKSSSSGETYDEAADPNCAGNEDLPQSNNSSITDPSEDASPSEVSKALGGNGHGSAKMQTDSSDDDDRADVYIPETSTTLSELSIGRVENVPAQVLLGIGNQKPVFWEFGHPQLPNRHLLIFGRSGSGKTYAIQAILAELSKQGQNSLIVDYTDGFLTKRLEKGFRDSASPKTYVTRSKPLPINPFRFQSTVLDDLDGEILVDKSSDVAARFVDVIDTAYQLGSQQKNALYQVVKVGLDSDAPGFDMSGMLNLLQNSDLDGADTLATKLTPFAEGSFLGTEQGLSSWDSFFTDRENPIHILQMTQIPNQAARVITEFVLWDLFYYARTNGSPQNPRVIVLDEVQNLSHALESPLGKILTEGRKFGLSLILATQTLSAIDRSERDRLFQASHKLFFAPAETELREYSKLLSDNTSISADDWKEKLRSLKKGECWSLGPVATGSDLRDRPLKIRISSFEERQLGRPSSSMVSG